MLVAISIRTPHFLRFAANFASSFPCLLFKIITLSSRCFSAARRKWCLALVTQYLYVAFHPSGPLQPLCEFLKLSKLPIARSASRYRRRRDLVDRRAVRRGGRSAIRCTASADFEGRCAAPVWQSSSSMLSRVYPWAQR